MHDKSPDGVRFHLADTYLSELEAVSGGELGPKQTVTFILPWVNMISGIRRWANTNTRMNVINFFSFVRLKECSHVGNFEAILTS